MSYLSKGQLFAFLKILDRNTLLEKMYGRHLFRNRGLEMGANYNLLSWVHAHQLSYQQNVTDIVNIVTEHYKFGCIQFLALCSCLEIKGGSATSYVIIRTQGPNGIVKLNLDMLPVILIYQKS